MCSVLFYGCVCLCLGVHMLHVCVCVWIRTRRPVILCVYVCVCAYLRACVGGVYMWVCGMFVCLFLYELSADTLLYVCVCVCVHMQYTVRFTDTEIAFISDITGYHAYCATLTIMGCSLFCHDVPWYGMGGGKGSGCVLACTSVRARSMCVFGGVLQGKRVRFVYVCVEQKIVWGLGVRVCADV